MSARTHYLNARQTLRKLLDWRVVPIINENDTTTTDEISFGNNDFLAAQVAILLGAELLLLLTDAEGVFTADPRVDPEAALVDRVDDFSELDALDIGADDLAARLGRDALQGRRRRDGDRRRHPHGHRQRADAGHDRRGRRRRAVGTASRARGALLKLQAMAEVRQAGPRPGAGRRRCGAGAARGWHQPAARRGRRRRRQLRRRRRGRDRHDDRGRWARGSATTRPPSCARCAVCSPPPSASCCRCASDEAIHRDYFVLA